MPACLRVGLTASLRTNLWRRIFRPASVILLLVRRGRMSLRNNVALVIGARWPMTASGVKRTCGQHPLQIRVRWAAVD